MAIIQSFHAIRPTAELAAKVAALPYDVMTSEEAREMVKGNEYSFLHVDKAEIDLDPAIHVYDEQVYQKAKTNLYKLIEDGVLRKDDESCLYLYMQTMNGRSQTGIVALTSIDDYLNGVIKKHELTREDKEQDRIKHVEYCDANTGPIFLAHKDNNFITAVVNNWKKKNRPVVTFTSEDGIDHTVWVIDEPSVIEKLTESFAKLDSLYIADGHHRNASAAKVGLKKREQNKNHTGDEEYNFYLSVIFPAGELKIMEYNRLVKDLNGKTKVRIFDEIRQNFECEPMADGIFVAPTEKNSFGMYIDNQWYLLKAKPAILENQDAIQALDVSILQNYILTPILAIGDPRSDKRIDFVGGIRGAGELQKRVDSGEMSIAFYMHATSMQDLMNVANDNQIMPPKSTWFEPKLRSGLFIHLLS